MIRFITRPSFILGLTIGVFLAVLVKVNFKSTKVEVSNIPRPFKPLTYDKFLAKNKITRVQLSFDQIRYSNKTHFLESYFLYKKVDIFCIILVKSSKNAEAAQDTWSRHCNKVDLVNLSKNKKIVPIKSKSEKSSWIQLCEKLREVPERTQWVLIVYDYTFVLMENLRLLIAGLNYEDKYYLGHAVKFWNTVYNLGQAGYVLSKGVVNGLKRKFQNADSCAITLTYRNQEDYYLGQHLASLNITPMDTRDMNDFSTFHPYNLYHVFFPRQNFYKASVYGHKCCSPYTVAFQAIEGDKMYTYYYLLYKLQLFYYGNFGNRPPVKTASDDEVWKKFLKERNISQNVTSEQYYKIWENIVGDSLLFAKHMKSEKSGDYL